jgi:hypothetical protein
MYTTPFSRPTRDPHSLTYTLRGTTLLQVNRSYRQSYDHLSERGLYRQLAADDLMRPHPEGGLKHARTDDAYRVLRLPVYDTPLTYPHEWPFSAWQAGALLTLDVLQTALNLGMVLSRATPHSVRFDGTTPVWADALAFDIYTDGRRWHGYEGFVRGWLAPLALMALVDPGLTRLARAYPHGLPLATASAMLPVRTRVNLGLMTHIHSAGRDLLAGRSDTASISETIISLRDTIHSLPTPPAVVPATHHDQTLKQQRGMRLRGHLGNLLPDVVWDMAAGDGTHTRLAAELAQQVVAFDSDPANVEWLWQSLTEKESGQIIPVVQDWTDPTPNGGWAYRDQRSIAARGNPSVVLALDWLPRLVWQHGLALRDIAAFLARLAPYVIVEYVPPADPQAIAHMPPQTSADDRHTISAFEAAFETHFERVHADPLRPTERVIYLMRRREAS